MKKLIAVLAVIFSIDAAAYTGTGNDCIDAAREYMHELAGGANIDYSSVNYFVGAVSGMSDIYGQQTYEYQVC